MNRVEPIREVEDIQAIKNMLLENEEYRDYALFTCGINWGLRISDLIGSKKKEPIKVKDVVDRKGRIKESFEVKEQKTSKYNNIGITDVVREALELLFENTPIKHNRENPLFFSKNRPNRAISRVQAYRLIRSWCNEVGLEDIKIGTHTFRKTMGFQWFNAGEHIAVIQERFNHSSPSQTRKYIGVTSRMLNDAAKRNQI